MAANHTVSGDYAVGTSNLSIFQGIAGKLPYGTHYVYWRDGQYVYRLAYSSSLAYDGSRFTGQDVEVVSYTTNTGYGSQVTLVHSQEVTFSLTPGSYLVWSDLGHYPTLYERGVETYVYAAVFGGAVFFVLYLLNSIFRSIRL